MAGDFLAETARSAAETWTRTSCPYCGVGCGLLVNSRENRLLKIKGDPEHPSSQGELCPKAAHLHKVIQTPDRLLFPQVRQRRDMPFARMSWERTLQFVAANLQAIRTQYSPEAVAFYGSGQLLTEDYYVANKLVKGFWGANNFDANSRLCMASAVAGYTTAFGADGPPLAYSDLDCAEFFFIIGANTADCHPVLHWRIARRKQQAAERVRVVVVDPRRTETADIADLHIPLRPGTDIVLLNAMLHVIIRDNCVDKAFIEQHTRGWEAVQVQVQPYTPAYAQEVCGIPAAMIVDLARHFATSQGTVSLWSMGLNQSSEGVAKNQALINLHLATGHIGKAGAGPFSLTGQPNAMGGREVGGLSHLLPGYRHITNPAHRTEMAHFWGVAEHAISPRPGYSAVELFEALDAGEVKALWIIATNPLVSMPDLDLVERALRKAAFVVVQDAYHPTDTTQFADVLLPAAQWPEKEGTMTNSERRITYLPQILQAPGEALPDWRILTRFAHAMGWQEAFAYTSAEDVFNEFKRCTTGRPNDITGVSYARLRQQPLQWPCPAPHSPGTERLYTNQQFPTPEGLARFIPVAYQGPQEPPNTMYPLTLTTGRVKNHWHTRTRTAHVDIFNRRNPEPFVEIHRDDARRLGIQDADFVEVLGRRGKVIAQARVTTEIAPGTCFIPMHWGRLAGFYKAANNLTNRVYDPISKQSELKYAAISIRKVIDVVFPD